MILLIGSVETAEIKLPRISGDNRYATAAQAAYLNWPNGSDNVVLVSGKEYADAESASTLAKKLDAPVLLTTPDILNRNTKDVLVSKQNKNYAYQISIIVVNKYLSN